MRTGMVGGINNFGFVRYAAFNTRTQTPAQQANPVSAADRRETLADVFRHTRSLRGGLAELRKAFGASDLKAVELQGSIGLDFTEAKSTYTAREEVNTASTSYETHAPNFPNSGSEVTIDGDYDGDQGTSRLKFKVTRGGTVGSNPSRIDVRYYEENGSQIGRIRIQPSHNPGRIYTLSNKLRVSFSAGTLQQNDEFFLNVSDEVGTDANPDNPLNGTRESDADLKWGEYVQNGSFRVNGETINVSASDSLNDVLGKINASDAGVTAAYDANTDTVQLENNEFGDGAITLTNDSSRFLRSVKLNGGSLVRGKTADDRTTIRDVDPLNAISSGTVRIGNTDVSVDINSDTLEDVIERINASAADVTATLNRSTGRFSLKSNRPGTDVRLDDQGTNLFSTLGLLNGTHRAKGGPPSKRISEILAEIGKDINAIFDPRLAENDILTGLRNGIKAAFGGTVKDDGSKDYIKTGFGLRLDFREGKGDPVKFGVREARKFRSSIRRGSLESKRFFTHGKGQGTKGSLLESLQSLTKGADERIIKELGPRGLFLNVRG